MTEATFKPSRWRHHASMTLLAFVTLSATAFPGQVTDLERWVEVHTYGVERLLCEREVPGVYFLVASADSRIKTGYRIDVTSTSGAPAPFIVGWRFQDQHGDYMKMRAEPDVVRKGYAREGDRIYAEEVA